MTFGVEPPWRSGSAGEETGRDTCATWIAGVRSTRMFIVLDANIWLAELAFRSGIGSTVRSFILNKGATVAVPEVVRREVEINFESTLNANAEAIRKAHRHLLAMFGEMHDMELPTPAAIRAKAQSIVSELDVPMLDVAFTLEAARSSLEKVLLKQPPSEKTQQFKDGVIWANCLMLAQEADVYLISDDRQFYKGQ